jgi:predicted acetyltransferase
MQWNIRPIEETELETWYTVVTGAEGRDLIADELKYGGLGVHLDRTLAAFDDGEIVGSAHNEVLDMTVPGATLKSALVAYVGTMPTHRRRGILTALMRRQLEDVHEDGVPLAHLQSSESVIYGRFGYGIGAYCEDWSIERHHTAFARDLARAGSLRFVSPDEMRDVFPDVYGRANASRPGVVPLSEHRWDARMWDLEFTRGGGSRFFHIVYEDSGTVDGYVTYRIRGSSLIVRELMSTTYSAYASLWRYCFDVDLRTETVARDRPVDDPLPWMLADPRRLHRSLRDGVWLRLVDVEAALAARSYATAGTLVIDVQDGTCPWNQGRYSLDVGPEGAHIRRTTAEPDIIMPASCLATCYLGAATVSSLARAGRVEVRSEGTLALADLMFATSKQPWSPDPWPL